VKNNRNKLSRHYWLTVLLVFVASFFCISVFATETGPSDINVTITTHLGDDQHFQAGDEISLLLNLDRDAYLLLVYRDASGNLVKLFPVRKNDNGWVPAGDFIPFPRRADRLRLIVSPPFGEEQVWAFAAAEAFPGTPLKNIDDIESLRKQLLSTGISFSAAHTRLTTHAKQR
jgi:Domain of unknown function (DUF4384)